MQPAGHPSKERLNFRKLIRNYTALARARFFLEMIGKNSASGIFDALAVLNFLWKNRGRKCTTADGIKFLSSYLELKQKYCETERLSVPTQPTWSRLLWVLRNIFQVKIEFDYVRGTYEISDLGILDEARFMGMMDDFYARPEDFFLPAKPKK